MRFRDLYASGAPRISFEVFPPKTDRGLVDLHSRLPELVSLGPSFISVTYGAFGTTRDRTLELACAIQREHGLPSAHHLTCLAATRSEIDDVLRRIAESGIDNIVALRGDPPKGEKEFRPPQGGFLHANELVEHIARFGGFGVGVAGYPEKHIEAPSMEEDLLNLKRKADSGADVIFTQLFFDNRHYYEFVKRCRALGLTQPIIPGLMPINNVEQISRMVGMCGATIPEELMKRLQGASSDQVSRIGIEQTADQAIELLRNGAPGIHFYVLNQCRQISEILARVRSGVTLGDR
jgi:methylenetetrahydrofolate reductase (NADPH)